MTSTVVLTPDTELLEAEPIADLLKEADARCTAVEAELRRLLDRNNELVGKLRQADLRHRSVQRYIKDLITKRQACPHCREV